jgi:hypothetical protein
MVDMLTCHRERIPKFDVVESEILYGCESVQTVSQRVLREGGGEISMCRILSFTVLSPHSCGRVRALLSVPGK